MFLPGGTVVVAVSGGPDSVCLLHALVRLRRLLRIDVACFHFDHGLRKDSAEDARYVGGLAQRIGVPFLLRRADGAPAPGDSVEAWARTVRYRALAAVVEELEAQAAAVAHTADDQAETVLLALVRGGGIEALSGMVPVSRPVVRPLLEVTREETEAFCRALRLRPRRDPMNRDTNLLRPAIRHRVIPHLERLLGRGIRQPLVRSAELLRADAELLDALATEAAARAMRVEADGSILVVASGLVGVPPALGRRVVKRALLEAGLVPGSVHIEAVYALASGRPGKQVLLPGGLRARAERGYVRLSPPSPPNRP